MANSPWWLGKKGEWYVIIQVLLFLLVVFGPRTFRGMGAWPQPLLMPASILGGAFILLGGTLAMSGLLALGKNLSPLPHPLEDAEFVEKGPYRIVRHPIYSGILLGAFGWAGVAHGTLTILYALILLLFFDLKSRREERWLAAKFSEYADYRLRVRKLIPFIY